MAESKLDKAENDAFLVLIIAACILAFVALAPGLLVVWGINLLTGHALARDLLGSQLVSLAAVISLVIYSVVVASSSESGWGATFRFLGLGLLCCFLFAFSYWGLHSNSIAHFLGRIDWFSIIAFLGNHLPSELFIFLGAFFGGAGFWLVGLFLLLTGTHSDAAQAWMWAGAVQIAVFFWLAYVQRVNTPGEDFWGICTLSLVLGLPLLCLAHWGLLLHWPVTLCHYFVPNPAWDVH